MINKFSSIKHYLLLSRQGLAYLPILCVSILLALITACSAKTENSEPAQNVVVPVKSIPSRPVEQEPQVRNERTREFDQPASQNVAISQAPVSADSVEEVIVSGSFVQRAEGFSAASPVVQTSSAEALRQAQHYYGPVTNTENYLAVDENLIKKASESPLSTFSIDVDTAAYSNLRRMLTREGRLPPHDAVRLEEMINYFDYDYFTPDNLDQPLAINTELMASPWNPGNHLLMVGVKGYEQAQDSRPDANLVFLVDVSGSMQSPDKLGLVKSSLKLLVSQMQEEDQIALVVYAGAAGMVLDSTSGEDKAKINRAIDSLTAGGSTNGAAGIELAYAIAEENQIDGGINRVIIASDGDLNVGLTSIDALKEMVENKRENGISLTSLGFGSGNYNYSLMEQIADVGNGNAAYIDTLREARKVLIEEMQSTLLTIAKDVKIQVEFNPAVIAEYRLIGYENRILNREDFRNDKVDAGEIGAGHTVTALYEISLVGSETNSIPDLRYSQVTATEVDRNSELGYVNIRYKRPDEDKGNEFGIAIQNPANTDNVADVSNNIRFAAAVAGFGQLLRGGKHTGDWGYDELLQLAQQSRGQDPHGYRSELMELVELAKVL